MIGRHTQATDTSFGLNFSFFTATDDTDLHGNKIPRKEESTSGVVCYTLLVDGQNKAKSQSTERTTAG